MVPHSSVDREVHWTRSGWRGWIYGWKLHLVATAAAVWILLAATVTPANRADNEGAPTLPLVGALGQAGPDVAKLLEREAMPLAHLSEGAESDHVWEGIDPGER